MSPTVMNVSGYTIVFNVFDNFVFVMLLNVKWLLRALSRINTLNKHNFSFKNHNYLQIRDTA